MACDLPVFSFTFAAGMACCTCWMAMRRMAAWVASARVRRARILAFQRLADATRLRAITESQLVALRYRIQQRQARESGMIDLDVEVGFTGDEVSIPECPAAREIRQEPARLQAAVPRRAKAEFAAYPRYQGELVYIVEAGKQARDGWYRHKYVSSLEEPALPPVREDAGAFLMAMLFPPR